MQDRPAPRAGVAPTKLHQELGAGVAHHKAGRLDKAEACYRRVLKQAPAHPDALNLLGLVAIAQGRPEQAITLIRQALASVPDFADAHLNLGDAFRAAGRLDEAAGSYRRAIALHPAFAEAHSNLGLVLGQQRRYAEAVASCRLAIRLNPGLAEAHLNLAVALRGMGEREEAERACREALRLAPGRAEAWTELGTLLLEADRTGEALDCHAKAVSLAPRHAPAHHALGVTLFRRAEMEAAAASFRRAAELAPRSAESWNGLGRALRALGRFDEAAACFERALAADPDLADAYRNLANTGRTPAAADGMDRLAAIAADEGAPAANRVAAGFALGKLLDEAGEYDQAFARYAEANALFLRTQAPPGEAFDAAALGRHVEALETAFTPEFFAANGAAGSGSEVPVFVVGMPRSGTSLVEQILASHSRVFGAGELRDVGALDARLRAAGLGRSPRAGVDPAVDPTLARSLADAHVARLVGLAGGHAARVIDKMPDNLFHLGTIAVLFPAARVIFCHRDARDTCLSCYFQLFTSGNLFSYDLAWCGLRYRHAERLAAHWRRVLPLRMLDIRYEALAADLEGESRRLVDFLGLPWEPACLAFHRTERVVNTASSWQVRQPIHDRSVGRWRNYARHLDPLFEALGGRDVPARTP